MAKRKAGYKQLTEESYKSIKRLQEDGYKDSDIAGLTKRSSGTLSYIRRSKNFAEYLDMIRKTYKSEKISHEPQPQRQEELSVIPRFVVEVLEGLVDMQAETNRQLARIATALEKANEPVITSSEEPTQD